MRSKVALSKNWVSIIPTKKGWSNLSLPMQKGRDRTDEYQAEWMEEEFSRSAVQLPFTPLTD